MKKSSVGPVIGFIAVLALLGYVGRNYKTIAIVGGAVLVLLALLFVLANKKAKKQKEQERKNDRIVYCTAGGTSYHLSPACGAISGKQIIKLYRMDAVRKGLTPCRHCSVLK